MTPEDHNKYVGMAHVVYGVLHIVLMLVTAAFVFVMIGPLTTVDAGGGNRPMAPFMSVILLVAVLVNVLLAVPSFVAGYAFLKRKSWAKIAGIVAAALSALRIPFGTAVSIYTFWFLFSTPGKILYDNMARVLPPAPPADWSAVGRTRNKESYVAPASPPDWR